MKTETKLKLVKCIDRLQDQIKGGPGSGPRPGGGGRASTSATAVRASRAASASTGAALRGMSPERRREHEKHLANAYSARDRAESGKHKEASDAHGMMAFMHRSLAGSPKTDHERGLHKEAERLHSEAAYANMAAHNDSKKS